MIIAVFIQQGKEIQLLHVFEEDLIIGSERPVNTMETPDSPHTGIQNTALSNTAIQN